MPGVFDLLFADFTEFRVYCRIIHVGRPGVQALARAELLKISRVLLAGIIELFRFFLGIEVIKISEPLVEAVDGRQELIAVAKVVLTELAGRVAL